MLTFQLVFLLFLSINFTLLFPFTQFPTSAASITNMPGGLFVVAHHRGLALFAWRSLVFQCSVAERCFCFLMSEFQDKSWNCGGMIAE